MYPHPTSQQAKGASGISHVCTHRESSKCEGVLLFGGVKVVQIPAFSWHYSLLVPWRFQHDAKVRNNAFQILAELARQQQGHPFPPFFRRAAYIKFPSFPLFFFANSLIGGGGGRKGRRRRKRRGAGASGITKKRRKRGLLLLPLL